MEALSDSLRTHFGFDSFRPGQAEAIQCLLDGRHALAVMPTGSGKSLIYQLAALHRPGVTLVISPLIALMQDQVDGLTRRGIPATYINSTIPTDEQRRRLRLMAEGAFRLMYVAPERLRSTAFQEALGRVRVGLLAVDEAHCISEWGHDFRPDYLHLAAARARLGEPLTAALTATATPTVQDDIVRLLGLSSARRLVVGFNRPNLTFEVRYTAGLRAKLETLQSLLAGRPGAACIIYVGTRRDAEEVAEFVQAVPKISAEHYHGGLDGETRTRVQEAFLSGKLPVIVATNAFGMGIDRADVRQVIHFAMPGTLEAYYQEVGRAGRDGQAARAVLLYDPADRSLQEWRIAHEAPPSEGVRVLYEALGARGRAEAQWTVDELSAATGLRNVEVKLGLSQLETNGAVERLGDDGLRMLLRQGAWSEATARAAAAGAAVHQERRQAQLREMIQYGESNACRRRILLDHFGDRGPADAQRCCDNCLERNPAASAPPSPVGASLSQAERTALLILEAVRGLKWEVGRGKLAQLLKGSRAKEMEQFGYSRSAHYGRLAALSLPQIEELIGQLVTQGYLKGIGGDRPVVRLTPRGEAALEGGPPVLLHLPMRAEREAGGTAALTARLFDQGLTPGQIAFQRGLAESTIYGHLAQLLSEGALSLQRVVPEAVEAQVRSAITQAGGAATLAPIKALLPEAISWGEIRCVVEAWKREQTRGTTQPAETPGDPAGWTQTEAAVQQCVRARPGELPRSGVAKVLVGSSSARVAQFQDHPLFGWLDSRLYGRRREEVLQAVDRLIERGDLALDAQGKVIPGRSTEPVPTPVSRAEGDAIAAFLGRPHPRPLSGPGYTGWALDFNARFAGSDWSRGQIGALTYRLKYQSDPSALEPLVEQMADLCAKHPELGDVDALVPVPSSVPRSFEPVTALADALGDRLGLPIWMVLAKTRRTVPQKEVQTLAQKRANVAGAFGVAGAVSGRRLLVLDDLYDSGATLEEATRVLRRAGAVRVCVLTLTRTIHTDA